MDDVLRKILENHYSVLVREVARIKALLDEDTARRQQRAGIAGGDGSATMHNFQDKQQMVRTTVRSTQPVQPV